MPFYDTLGPESVTYILNHTNLTTVFCSGECAKVLSKTDNLGKLKTVVLFDDIEPETKSALQKRSLNILSFAEVNALR